MTHEKKPAIWTKNFIIIACSNFFLFLVFYALLTTLPIYVVDNLQRSEAEAGLVVTAFLITAVLIRPFSGKLLQDYGKKKILVICMAIFLIATFLYMFVESYYMLLILRLFHGIWFGIATTATGAVAADVVPLTRRGEGLGYFAMSMNIAVVAGPFIALTLLHSFPFNGLFFILGILMLGGLLGVLFLSMPMKEQRPVKTNKLSLDDLVERNALPIASVGIFISFAYASVISFISVYAQELGLIEAASFFFLVYAVTMVASRPFTGRLFDLKGPHVVIYPAMVLFILGLIALSITESAFMLLLSGALIGLGYGTLLPCFQTLAVQSADRKRSGHATATFFTLFDTGVALGAFALGGVASFLGYGQLYFYTGLFILLPLLLYTLVQRRRKNQPYSITHRIKDHSSEKEFT